MEEIWHFLTHLCDYFHFVTWKGESRASKLTAVADTTNWPRVCCPFIPFRYRIIWPSSRTCGHLDGGIFLWELGIGYVTRIGPMICQKWHNQYWLCLKVEAPPVNFFLPLGWEVTGIGNQCWGSQRQLPTWDPRWPRGGRTTLSTINLDY